MLYKLGSSVNTHFKCILAGLTDQGLLDRPQASNKQPHIFLITKPHMEQNRRKNRKSKRKFIGQDNSSLISEKKKPTMMYKQSLIIPHKQSNAPQCLNNGNLNRQNLPVFISDHGVNWCERTLWPIWVSCASSAPFQCLVPHP